MFGSGKLTYFWLLFVFYSVVQLRCSTALPICWWWFLFFRIISLFQVPHQRIVGLLSGSVRRPRCEVTFTLLRGWTLLSMISYMSSHDNKEYEASQQKQQHSAQKCLKNMVFAAKICPKNIQKPSFYGLLFGSFHILSSSLQDGKYSEKTPLFRRNTSENQQLFPNEILSVKRCAIYELMFSYFKNS